MDHSGRIIPTARAARIASCGLFKTPTLRNVTRRQVFFHNGAFHSIERVLQFYATRDTHPERWYPTVGGKVQKFDDLPPRHRGNIDPQLPLDGRARGSKPPLSGRQLDDLLCFLETLNDGYVPPSTPAAYRQVRRLTP